MYILTKIWSKLTPFHILILSIIILIATYFIFKSETRSCCVEVTLGGEDFLPSTVRPQLFNTGEKVVLNAEEFDCLSKNVYWESMYEPLIGQLSVIAVTHNRLLKRRWGDTFCQVIHRKNQFSWYNSPKLRAAIPKNKKQWHRAKHSVFLFTKGVRVTQLENSRFYYANYIPPPKWSKNMKKVAKIGTHIFLAASGE